MKKYRVNNANDIEGTLADHRPYHPVDYIEPTVEVDDLFDIKQELTKLLWIIQEMDCVVKPGQFATLLTTKQDDPDYEALRLMYESMTTPEMRGLTEKIALYMTTTRNTGHGRMIVMLTKKVMIYCQDFLILVNTNNKDRQI